MEKHKLMQELKKYYCNDFVVLYSHYNDFTYWIFGSHAEAKKHYNKINNSMLMNNMPCSLQLHLLR